MISKLQWSMLILMWVVIFALWFTLIETRSAVGKNKTLIIQRNDSTRVEHKVIMLNLDTIKNNLKR
jgi:hypothetical protein